MSVPPPPANTGGAYAAPAGGPGQDVPGRHYDTGPDSAGRHHDISDVSVGELIGEVSRDLSTLMRQELALAQAEIKQEATKTGKAAGGFAAAGFAGYMTLLFLSIALWWALHHVVGHSWSALIVAVVWGIVGAIGYAVGRRKLREVNPTPERTVDTLKNVPDALKGQRGGTP
jgi:hypothetical protein